MVYKCKVEYEFYERDFYKKVVDIIENFNSEYDNRKIFNAMIKDSYVVFLLTIKTAEEGLLYSQFVYNEKLRYRNALEYNEILQKTIEYIQRLFGKYTVKFNVDYCYPVDINEMFKKNIVRNGHFYSEYTNEQLRERLKHSRRLEEESYIQESFVLKCIITESLLRKIYNHFTDLFYSKKHIEKFFSSRILEHVIFRKEIPSVTSIIRFVLYLSDTRSVFYELNDLKQSVLIEFVDSVMSHQTVLVKAFKNVNLIKHGYLVEEQYTIDNKNYELEAIIETLLHIVKVIDRNGNISSNKMITLNKKK